MWPHMVCSSSGLWVYVTNTLLPISNVQCQVSRSWPSSQLQGLLSFPHWKESRWSKQAPHLEYTYTKQIVHLIFKFTWASYSTYFFAKSGNSTWKVPEIIWTDFRRAEALTLQIGTPLWGLEGIFGVNTTHVSFAPSLVTSESEVIPMLLSQFFPSFRRDRHCLAS